MSLPPLSEGDFLKQILALARLRGWQCAHFRPARTQHGWRTAVQGDGAGFPDLILVRGEVLIFAELKTDRGRLRRNQEEWISLLAGAGQQAHVWRPADWPTIEHLLS